MLSVWFHVTLLALSLTETAGVTLGNITEGIANLTVAGRAGFYLLGQVQVCGSIRSVCALGKINATSQSDDKATEGRVTIYVINTNNQNKRRLVPPLVQTENEVVCNSVDIPVRASDLIVVHTPRFCSAENVCPLHVDFESDEDGAQYYKNSDAINVANFSASDLHSSSLTPSKVRLNVNVTILEHADAQLGNVAVDETSLTGGETRTGLYRLGDVPDGCVYRQFCAFGETHPETYGIDVKASDKRVIGWLTFFIVRSSVNNKVFVVRESVNLKLDSSSRKEACVDSNTAVLRRDFIVVAIPNSCTENSTSILCPLKVNFRETGKSIVYYNNSLLHGIHNESVLASFLNSSKNNIISIGKEFLNVRVVTEGSEKPTIDHSARTKGSIPGTIGAVLTVTGIAIITITMAALCKYRRYLRKGVQVTRSSIALRELNSVTTHETDNQHPKGAYYLLEQEGAEVKSKLEEHDYDELYFEPASEEGDLLQQLHRMSVPLIEEKLLDYIMIREVPKELSHSDHGHPAGYQSY